MRGPKQLPRYERFYAHVTRGEDCWLWTGPVAMKRGGYGHFYDDNPHPPLARSVLRRAHRVAYELEYGISLTSEQVVMHLCDTPPCVRPSHLQLGTQQENLADMRAKGRGYVPDWHLALAARGLIS